MRHPAYLATSAVCRMLRPVGQRRRPATNAGKGMALKTDDRTAMALCPTATETTPAADGQGFGAAMAETMHKRTTDAQGARRMERDMGNLTFGDGR